MLIKVDKGLYPAYLFHTEYFILWIGYNDCCFRLENVYLPNLLKVINVHRRHYIFIFNGQIFKIQNIRLIFLIILRVHLPVNDDFKLIDNKQFNWLSSLKRDIARKLKEVVALSIFVKQVFILDFAYLLIRIFTFKKLAF